MTDSFEDRLWHDLLRDHGAQLTAPRPVAGARAHRRRPVLLGGAVGLAAAATALALALTASTTTPTAAYAVTQNSDATVTVTIHDIAGLVGANAELRRLGVRARAVPAVANCATPDARKVPAYQWEGKALRPDLGSSAVTITPTQIPHGDTLVLAAKELSHDHVELGVFMVRGRAPACSDQADAGHHSP